MDIKVTVNINAPDLAKAIHALASALLVDRVDFPEVTINQTPPETTEPNQAPKPEPEPKPVNEPDQTPDRPGPNPDPAPVITLETVRAKLAAISQAGKQAQVKQLLNDFGAAKLTEVPAEKYGDLLTAAEKIA